MIGFLEPKLLLVTGVIFLTIFLPHALLITHDAAASTRSLLFAAFAFLVSSLWATLLNYLEHQLEAQHEILALNEELNRYIKRLESTQRQLIQAEKLNAIGQLAASVAHEINNPLARDGKLGLAGMYERARLINARLEILSELGKGTRVIIELPVYD